MGLEDYNTGGYLNYLKVNTIFNLVTQSDELHFQGSTATFG